MRERECVCVREKVYVCVCVCVCVCASLSSCVQLTSEDKMASEHRLQIPYIHRIYGCMYVFGQPYLQYSPIVTPITLIHPHMNIHRIHVCIFGFGQPYL